MYANFYSVDRQSGWKNGAEYTLAQQAHIGVSITSVYNKLNALETEVPAALVQQTATEFDHRIMQLHAPCQTLLPDYRVKMLDGNCLAGMQHRLAVLRDKSAGALPGKSLGIQRSNT